MKTRILLLACLLFGLGGCASESKLFKIDPERDKVAKMLFFIEKDERGDEYAISGKKDDKTVIYVPNPAIVDANSTIYIAVSKQAAETGAALSPLTKASRQLLDRKLAVLAAVKSLDEVVRKRTRTLQAYDAKDLSAFYAARSESDRAEVQFRADLVNLWPRSDPQRYSALVQAYGADRRSFQKLNDFLTQEIAAIDVAQRDMEAQLKVRQSTLSIEAFLGGAGKETTAIHVQNYDKIADRDLVRRDPLGLDLSPEERQALQEQARATRELSEALERLRRGEQDLNETLRKLAADMAPQIGRLIQRAEDLYNGDVGPAALAARMAATEALFQDFVKEAARVDNAFGAKAQAELERSKNELMGKLRQQIPQFQRALADWRTTGAALKAGWEQARPDALTPDAMLNLINKSVDAVHAFDALWGQLPETARSFRQQTSNVLEGWLNDAKAETAKLMETPQALALKTELEKYATDLQRVGTLVVDIDATVGRLRHPVAELPPSAGTSFDIPLEEIKDGFVNLQRTPRLVGDTITIRATLKNADKVVDTSLATFQVDRIGYHAELSPAVVLAKPRQIAGTDDGFRFAPTLSWIHHWSPRSGYSFLRALDPGVGIHSAFLNFNSSTSSSSAQIGLGGTIAFWKNRLQFGVGRNLMARSSDEGRVYYFVGSDLIGLLQALGIGRLQ